MLQGVCLEAQHRKTENSTVRVKVQLKSDLIFKCFYLIRLPGVLKVFVVVLEFFNIINVFDSSYIFRA